MRQTTIRKRKRRGITTYYCDLGGRQYGLGADANEARGRFAELLAVHQGRQELLPPPVTAAEPIPALKVRAVLLAFLDWCKKNRAPATHKFYSYLLVSETTPAARAKRKNRKKSTNFASFDVWLRRKGLTDLLVADFGSAHVEDWINDHFPESADTYRHNLIRTVQAAFNWAMGQKQLRRQMGGENPLIGLKKPSQSPREGYISAEQWATIEQTVSGELLDFLMIIKETGCRPQEARAVEAKHFDRDGRRWYFAEPVKKVRGKKEPRIVHLTDRAFEICERLANKRPNGPLFRNDENHAWTRTALNARSFRLREKLGFNLCVYSLRHTFCTDALKSGVDPLTVAKLMGHKNAAMVMSVYNRLGECQDHLRDALRKIIR